jgi:phosphonopyruvate decarboxylase
MLPAEVFCAELADRGFTTASGVPCSYFGGPIELLSRIPGRYIPAANEGGALAVAAGAALAGDRMYVMLQNSGLGNLINPLTSLIMTYRIPVLIFVSLRGWPDPAGDEPQHEVMGPATFSILDALGVPHWTLRAHDDLSSFRGILNAVTQEMSEHGTPVVLVEKGAVGEAGDRPASPAERALDSSEVIRRIAGAARECAIIATTGYTARELFGLADKPGNFYMQGSMGHACSIGLGVALTRPDRTVVVLDGDGAALMHMGSLSVIGHQAPSNLVHVILDNGAHESTGGQRTTSGTTSFAAVGAATGYKTAVECRTAEDVDGAVQEAISTPGPHLCVIRTLPRTGEMPPRATSAYSAHRMRDRFSDALRKE